MKILATLLILPVFLLAACGSNGKSDPSTPAAASPSRSSLSQRMNEQNGYGQDAEGNWAPKIDRRSQFESQRNSPYFKGDVAKKDFKTGGYDKKPFWGTKEVERKAFDGKTDASRFQEQSKLGGKKSKEQGLMSDISKSYQTENYTTGSARETNGKRIDRTSDAETDARRKVFKAPSIINWEEQRSMSVSQTKGLLGRD